MKEKVTYRVLQMTESICLLKNANTLMKCGFLRASFLEFVRPYEMPQFYDESLLVERIVIVVPVHQPNFRFSVCFPMKTNK